MDGAYSRMCRCNSLGSWNVAWIGVRTSLAVSSVVRNSMSTFNALSFESSKNEVIGTPFSGCKRKFVRVLSTKTVREGLLLMIRKSFTTVLGNTSAQCCRNKQCRKYLLSGSIAFNTAREYSSSPAVNAISSYLEAAFFRNSSNPGLLNTVKVWSNTWISKHSRASGVRDPLEVCTSVSSMSKTTVSFPLSSNACDGSLKTWGKFSIFRRCS